MATSAARDGYIPLSDTPGDARRVQAILAEWGMDETTINRMLGERKNETNCRDDGAQENAARAAVDVGPLAH